MSFIESGTLRNYVDANGSTRRFTPSEEDIKRRDAAVLTQARVEDAIRANFRDALLWLIWGIVAAAFGYGVARDKPG